MLAGPDGRPAEARLTAAWAASGGSLAGVLSALHGRRITSLEVEGRLWLPVLPGLTQLSSLTAAGCKLNGSLAAFSELTALQSLTLKGCGLEHIPRSLAALSALTHLNLGRSGHYLGIPPLSSVSLAHVLPHLTALRHLDLSFCGLAELPAGMTALTGLTHLDLGSNSLSSASLACVLPGLTALRALNLRANRLVELPAGMAALSCLTHLGLGITRMSSRSLTNVLPHVTVLRHLDLHGCGMAEVPAVMAALAGLTHLDLSYNLPSPASLARVLPCLAALKSLNLEHCDLAEVPPGVAALTCLTFLSFCDELQGGWEYLRPLARLRNLTLACALLHTLPRDLTALQALRVLNLSHVSPRHGWRHLLALPRLRRLVVARRPPLEVQEAVADIELFGSDSATDSESDYLSSDSDAASA